MSAPEGLFDTADADPIPVRGRVWPWPKPDGFEIRNYDRCLVISGSWNYCARARGHTGLHAECNAAGNVTAVWEVIA